MKDPPDPGRSIKDARRQGQARHAPGGLKELV
jgi:hypothetical protein